MRDEFWRSNLFIIIILFIHSTQQLDAPKHGSTNSKQQKFQSNDENALLLMPQECVEMCDDSGCFYYCPQPSKAIKRCATRANINKRLCCTTDGALSPPSDDLQQSLDTPQGIYPLLQKPIPGSLNSMKNSARFQSTKEDRRLSLEALKSLFQKRRHDLSKTRSFALPKKIGTKSQEKATNNSSETSKQSVNLFPVLQKTSPLHTSEHQYIVERWNSSLPGRTTKYMTPETVKDNTPNVIDEKYSGQRLLNSNEHYQESSKEEFKDLRQPQLAHFVLPSHLSSVQDRDDFDTKMVLDNSPVSSDQLIGNNDQVETAKENEFESSTPLAMTEMIINMASKSLETEEQPKEGQKTLLSENLIKESGEVSDNSRLATYPTSSEFVNNVVVRTQLENGNLTNNQEMEHKTYEEMVKAYAPGEANVETVNNFSNEIQDNKNEATIRYEGQDPTLVTQTPKQMDILEISKQSELTASSHSLPPIDYEIPEAMNEMIIRSMTNDNEENIIKDKNEHEANDRTADKENQLTPRSHVLKNEQNRHVENRYIQKSQHSVSETNENVQNYPEFSVPEVITEENTPESDDNYNGYESISNKSKITLEQFLSEIDDQIEELKQEELRYILNTGKIENGIEIESRKDGTAEYGRRNETPNQNVLVPILHPLVTNENIKQSTYSETQEEPQVAKALPLTRNEIKKIQEYSESNMPEVMSENIIPNTNGKTTENGNGDLVNYSVDGEPQSMSMMQDLENFSTKQMNSGSLSSVTKIMNDTIEETINDEIKIPEVLEVVVPKSMADKIIHSETGEPIENLERTETTQPIPQSQDFSENNMKKLRIEEITEKSQFYTDNIKSQYNDRSQEKEEIELVIPQAILGNIVENISQDSGNNEVLEDQGAIRKLNTENVKYSDSVQMTNEPETLVNNPADVSHEKFGTGKELENTVRMKTEDSIPTMQIESQSKGPTVTMENADQIVTKNGWIPLSLQLSKEHLKQSGNLKITTQFQIPIDHLLSENDNPEENHEAVGEVLTRGIDEKLVENLSSLEPTETKRQEGAFENSKPITLYQLLTNETMKLLDNLEISGQYQTNTPNNSTDKTKEALEEKPVGIQPYISMTRPDPLSKISSDDFSEKSDNEDSLNELENVTAERPWQKNYNYSEHALLSSSKEISISDNPEELSAIETTENGSETSTIHKPNIKGELINEIPPTEVASEVNNRHTVFSKLNPNLPAFDENNKATFTALSTNEEQSSKRPEILYERDDKSPTEPVIAYYEISPKKVDLVPLSLTLDINGTETQSIDDTKYQNVLEDNIGHADALSSTENKFQLLMEEKRNEIKGNENLIELPIYEKRVDNIENSSDVYVNDLPSIRALGNKLESKTKSSVAGGTLLQGSNEQGVYISDKIIPSGRLNTIPTLSAPRDTTMPPLNDLSLDPTPLFIPHNKEESMHVERNAEYEKFPNNIRLNNEHQILQNVAQKRNSTDQPANMGIINESERRAYFQETPNHFLDGLTAGANAEDVHYGPFELSQPEIDYGKVIHELPTKYLAEKNLTENVGNTTSASNVQYMPYDQYLILDHGNQNLDEFYNHFYNDEPEKGTDSSYNSTSIFDKHGTLSKQNGSITNSVLQPAVNNVSQMESGQHQTLSPINDNQRVDSIHDFVRKFEEGKMKETINKRNFIGLQNSRSEHPENNETEIQKLDNNEDHNDHKSDNEAEQNRNDNINSQESWIDGTSYVTISHEKLNEDSQPRGENNILVKKLNFVYDNNTNSIKIMSNGSKTSSNAEHQKNSNTLTQIQDLDKEGRNNQITVNNNPIPLHSNEINLINNNLEDKQSKSLDYDMFQTVEEGLNGAMRVKESVTSNEEYTNDSKEGMEYFKHQNQDIPQPLERLPSDDKKIIHVSSQDTLKISNPSINDSERTNEEINTSLEIEDNLDKTYYSAIEPTNVDSMGQNRTSYYENQSTEPNLSSKQDQLELPNSYAPYLVQNDNESNLSTRYHSSSSNIPETDLRLALGSEKNDISSTKFHNENEVKLKPTIDEDRQHLSTSYSLEHGNNSSHTVKNQLSNTIKNQDIKMNYDNSVHSSMSRLSENDYLYNNSRTQDDYKSLESDEKALVQEILSLIHEKLEQGSNVRFSQDKHISTFDTTQITDKSERDHPLNNNNTSEDPVYKSDEYQEVQNLRVADLKSNFKKQIPDPIIAKILQSESHSKGGTLNTKQYMKGSSEKTDQMTIQTPERINPLALSANTNLHSYTNINSENRGGPTSAQTPMDNKMKIFELLGLKDFVNFPIKSDREQRATEKDIYLQESRRNERKPSENHDCPCSSVKSESTKPDLYKSIESQDTALDKKSPIYVFVGGNYKIELSGNPIVTVKDSTPFKHIHDDTTFSINGLKPNNDYEFVNGQYVKVDNTNSVDKIKHYDNNLAKEIEFNFNTSNTSPHYPISKEFLAKQNDETQDVKNEFDSKDSKEIISNNEHHSGMNNNKFISESKGIYSENNPNYVTTGQEKSGYPLEQERNDRGTPNTNKYYDTELGDMLRKDSGTKIDHYIKNNVQQPIPPVVNEKSTVDQNYLVPTYIYVRTS